ncbi:16363_t:CDS:2, partial [Racocetra fulgida]
VLSIEPVLVSKDPIFEETSKDLSLMSNSEVSELPVTHTEEFNDLDYGSSEEMQDQAVHGPRQRPRAGRSIIGDSTAEKNNEGASEVTKRLSSWFSSLWISPQEISGDASDKDDPDFAHFKKGLFNSFNNIKSESTIDSSKDNSIWLMGVRYEANNDRISSEFSGSFYETSYYYSTPGTFPHISMQQPILSPANFPADFYDDFTSRIWALVEDFPAAHLSVYVATDGVVYKNEVYKAGKNNRAGKDFQSVLILVAIRLGINNLNPIYHNALKISEKYKSVFTIAQEAPIYGDDVSDLDVFSEDDDDEFEKFENDDENVDD